MKIRIKFAKEGAMKFIGHLDIMRYFQRAIRRAGIDVAYSEGFSPHMIMSFANPLGVGLTSEAEYFDLVIHTAYPSQELIDRLNAVMVEGMRVLNVVQVPEEKASKAMSLVAAADYLVRFRYPETLPTDWREKFSTFMEQPSVTVTKKTKKGEKEIDIRPLLAHRHRPAILPDGNGSAVIHHGKARPFRQQALLKRNGSVCLIQRPAGAI